MKESTFNTIHKLLKEESKKNPSFNEVLKEFSQFRKKTIIDPKFSFKSKMNQIAESYGIKITVGNDGEDKPTSGNSDEQGNASDTANQLLHDDEQVDYNQISVMDYINTLKQKNPSITPEQIAQEIEKLYQNPQDLNNQPNPNQTSDGSNISGVGNPINQNGQPNQTSGTTNQPQSNPQNQNQGSSNQKFNNKF